MPDKSECHSHTGINAEYFDAWKWGHGTEQTAGKYRVRAISNLL